MIEENWTSAKKPGDVEYSMAGEAGGVFYLTAQLKASVVKVTCQKQFASQPTRQQVEESFSDADLR